MPWQWLQCIHSQATTGGEGIVISTGARGTWVWGCGWATGTHPCRRGLHAASYACDPESTQGRGHLGPPCNNQRKVCPGPDQDPRNELRRPVVAGRASNGGQPEEVPASYFADCMLYGAARGAERDRAPQCAVEALSHRGGSRADRSLERALAFGLAVFVLWRSYRHALHRWSPSCRRGICTDQGSDDGRNPRGGLRLDSPEEGHRCAWLLQGQRSSQVAARSCEEYQAEGPLAAPLPGDTGECTPFAGLQAGATLHASPEVGQGPCSAWRTRCSPRMATRRWLGSDRGVEHVWHAPQPHGCHVMRVLGDFSRAGRVGPPESREASHTTFFCRLRA